MKKYTIIVGLSALSLLLAEDNLFPISEYFQKLDQEKTTFLDTLNDAGNRSHSIATRSNQVKEVSIAIPQKPLPSPEVKQSTVISSRLAQDQVEIKKRIAKAKKIRQERAEALRIKKHAEEIRRMKQSKLKKSAQEKRKAEERQKKHIKSTTMHKVEKKRQRRSLKGKEPSLKTKEAVEQAYLDAIKAVNLF